MNKSILILLLSILFFSCANPERNLLWEENFSSQELDSNHWNIILGDGCPNLCGWGNAELQWYTDTNHQIKDGKLVIMAKKESNHYTSTRITTQGKKEFQYGYIEISAKIPQGQGIWPAFWLLGHNIETVGWPLCGEIDVLEYVGRAPGEIFTSLHTQASHGNTINSKTTTIENIEDGFHKYAIDWTSEKIDFYVDDKLVYTFNPTEKNEEIWPFDQPFYMILNVAIGGNFGGPEVDDSIFPQEFIIDYIRVYDKK